MEIQTGNYPCAQCGKGFPLGEFVGKRGGVIKRCQGCQKLYSGGNYGIRGSEPRRLLRVVAPDAQVRVTWISKSGNKKLGPIPVAIVSPETCPPSCGFYGKGCYAEFGWSGRYWRAVEHRGLVWDEFVERVRALPARQLWRYAIAGDLPGEGEELDADALSALVTANQGKRGFAISHKRMDFRQKKHRRAIQAATSQGFTINLSADTLAQADEKAALGIAPVVVVLPQGASGDIRTPEGRRIVLCPARKATALRPGITCQSCQLCSIPDRKGIVGFIAHGQMQKTVTKIARGESIDG